MSCWGPCKGVPLRVSHPCTCYTGRHNKCQHNAVSLVLCLCTHPHTHLCIIVSSKLQQCALTLTESYVFFSPALGWGFRGSLLKLRSPCLFGYTYTHTHTRVTHPHPHVTHPHPHTATHPHPHVTHIHTQPHTHIHTSHTHIHTQPHTHIHTLKATHAAHTINAGRVFTVCLHTHCLQWGLHQG